MNLKELLKLHTDKEITKRLVELYPDQKGCIGGYKKVLALLRNKRPKKDDMIITVETVKDVDEEEYVSVDGLKNGERYGIEFTSWSIWLGMEISPKSLIDFSYLDIICECLWEMTFMGFTEQQLYRCRKMLEGRVEDLMLKEKK